MIKAEGKEHVENGQHPRHHKLPQETVVITLVSEDKQLTGAMLKATGQIMSSATFVSIYRTTIIIDFGEMCIYKYTFFLTKKADRRSALKSVVYIMYY